MKRIIDGNPNTKEHWKRVYDEHGAYITVVQEYRYQIVGWHIANTNCRVVDLGCGTGVLDLFIKHLRPNALITGVDLFSSGKDLVAEKDGQEIKLFENFVEGDACNTGLPSGYYDYAISIEVLEHLDEPQKLADEMYRLLNANGKVILTTPLYDRLPSSEHVWQFTLRDVKKMFIRAGFKHVYVSPFSSGGKGLNADDKVVTPEGTWDEIWVLACKGEV